MSNNLLFYLFLIVFPKICIAADWALIERYRDLEILYDTSSIKRIHNEVQVNTLTNYFVLKKSGASFIKSKTQIHTVYCDREMLETHFATEYSELNASGKVLFSTPLEDVIVETERHTVAGDIYEAVCESKT